MTGDMNGSYSDIVIGGFSNMDYFDTTGPDHKAVPQ